MHLRQFKTIVIFGFQTKFLMIDPRKSKQNKQKTIALKFGTKQIYNFHRDEVTKQTFLVLVLRQGENNSSFVMQLCVLKNWTGFEHVNL